MKGILNEIRSQPPHIREIFMWVCVIAVFSVVGFTWFRSTSKEFVALVNPERAQEEARQLAQREKELEGKSPFATILYSFRGLRANISELFDFTRKTSDFEILNVKQPKVPPNLMPRSEDKK